MTLTRIRLDMSKLLYCFCSCRRSNIFYKHFPIFFINISHSEHTFLGSLPDVYPTVIKKTWRQDWVWFHSTVFCTKVHAFYKDPQKFIEVNIFFFFVKLIVLCEFFYERVCNGNFMLFVRGFRIIIFKCSTSFL